MKIPSLILGGIVLAAAGTATADDRPTTPPNALGEMFFPFDSSNLSSEAAAVAARIESYAGNHPGSRVVLDASCDPVGTGPYNVGLAIRRAEAVRAELIAAGVAPEQIVFAIYGKDGTRRPTHAQDRRVTVWATHDPLVSVIARTFDGHGTAVTWAEPLTVAQLEAPPSRVATREVPRTRAIRL